MAKPKPKYIRKLSESLYDGEEPGTQFKTLFEIDLTETYENLKNTFTNQVKNKLAQLMENVDFVLRLNEAAWMYQRDKEIHKHHPNKTEILAALEKLKQNATELDDHFSRLDPITHQFFDKSADTIIEKILFEYNPKRPPIERTGSLRVDSALFDILKLFGIIIDNAKENFKASNYQRKNYARFALACNIRRLLRENKIDCTIYKDGLWAACMQIILSYCGETLSTEAILSILRGAGKQGPGYHGNILIPE